MSNSVATLAPAKKSPLTVMAERLSIDPAEMESVVRKTVMPAKVNVTNEQFVSFLAVANNYQLDPLKKEIYAFPAKGGGIQPVVSIDGWLSIINSHPQFDGMELRENYDDGRFVSVTCSIYRKDRGQPTVLTENLDECIRPTDPWKKPKRMLRHKATIQAARYAFGLSGIVEQDEAEAALGGEREVNPNAAASQVQSIKSKLVPKAEPAESNPVDDVAAPDVADQISYADVCAAINESQDNKQLAKAAAMAGEFLGLGDNGSFRDEIGSVYQARVASLKESKGE